MSKRQRLTVPLKWIAAELGEAKAQEIVRKGEAAAAAAREIERRESKIEALRVAAVRADRLRRYRVQETHFLKKRYRKAFTLYSQGVDWKTIADAMATDIHTVKYWASKYEHEEKGPAHDLGRMAQTPAEV